MRKERHRRVPVIAFLLAISFLPAAPAEPSFLAWTDEQKEHFLRNAEVIDSERLNIGITGSSRLTLKLDGVEHAAHFQSVNERALTKETAMGLELHFADSYKFNIAAYRLDRLLELEMIPVSIERRYEGKTGAFTWWVDDVLMMEKERYLNDIEPPDQRRWNEQIYRVRVFNELVYNMDPNLGNILITKDWEVWMIDFTRAFRPFKRIREEKNLEKIDRRLLAALEGIEEGEVRSALDGLLTGIELDGLLARRDLIVEFFKSRAEEEGGTAVYY